MAVLQCEICGGKLIGKPGGVFECDSCGMEYSTEWAKAKVQEIKGTVKIEGPVEVTGTVKVENGPKVDAMLRRAKRLLAGRQWIEAWKACEEILDIEPENTEVHLARMLVGMKVSTKEEAEEQYVLRGKALLSETELKKIPDPELTDWLKNLEEKRV